MTLAGVLRATGGLLALSATYLVLDACDFVVSVYTARGAPATNRLSCVAMRLAKIVVPNVAAVIVVGTAVSVGSAMV